MTSPFELVRPSQRTPGTMRDVPSKVDQCLFINHDKKIFCLVYIDDMIWVAPDQQRIDKVLESLKDEFEMTVEGDVMAFLAFNSNVYLAEKSRFNKLVSSKEC